MSLFSCESIIILTIKLQSRECNCSICCSIHFLRCAVSTGQCTSVSIRRIIFLNIELICILRDLNRCIRYDGLLRSAFYLFSMRSILVSKAFGKSKVHLTITIFAGTVIKEVEFTFNQHFTFCYDPSAAVTGSKIYQLCFRSKDKTTCRIKNNIFRCHNVPNDRLIEIFLNRCRINT